ncbi:methyltransferase-like 4 [Crotalus adamanteus]|uniref:Methyltransferase-like 4 n=1 Tax=Crotalus adamanteus TaxID=8729 RepID=A0AAW1BM57_CROAD
MVISGVPPKRLAVAVSYRREGSFSLGNEPHIPASFQTEKHSGTSLETSKCEQQKNDDNKSVITVKAKKKRKRSSELNHGESDILDYHLKISGIILDGNFSCMQPLLNYKKKYGIIVIDPPWENKSVKRSNRYGFLSHWQIKEIPVPALAAPNCLVVTWVTNRQKHLQFVKNELYPHWSIYGVVEWFWVKITKSGEFVIPLDSLHKKPYEILVLGRVQGNTDIPLRLSEDEKFSAIPDQKLIVSVPCTLHSHKPPLSEILKEYTKPDVECLELFARNLQPGWTSWGNEVLKFQHLDYFTVLQDNDD